MAEFSDIEKTVRTRLRSLRNTLGPSLDELAERTNLSASTISRVETGKRTISLDVLLPLAAALQVDPDALLAMSGDDDVSELIMIFDRDGQRTHVHHETSDYPTA